MNVSSKKNFLIINLFKILFIFILICFSISQVYIKAKSCFKDKENLKIIVPFVNKQYNNNNFKHQKEDINKFIEFEEVNKSSKSTSKLTPQVIDFDVTVKQSIINFINDLSDKLIEFVENKSFIFGYVIKLFKPIILSIINNIIIKLL